MPSAKPVLPGLDSIGKLQPLKPLRRPPVRLSGPRSLRLQSDPVAVGGPGEPPEGFVTAHQSALEWDVYWGFARVTRSPRDPRKPPFVGGDTWSYQKAVDGGRVHGGGGQVVDFVYQHPDGKTLGVRLQTEHWHIMVDATKQMQDFFLKSSTLAVDQIIDIFDSDFVGDRSGKSVCIVVANAIKGVQKFSPIFAGTSQRIRGGIR
jgi:hypothetical protein